MTRKLSLLPEIPYGIRPQILLVGNGINLSFDGAQSTDSIIKDEWKRNYGTDLPDRGRNTHEIWNLPFPLQVVAATKDHVQGCMAKLADVFKNASIQEEQAEFIHHILEAKFDAILSTNYSLEFEKSTIRDYSLGKVYSCYRITKEQTEQQKAFGIFQCTELPYSHHPLLWHIHGTALRKKSMIMGQMYYGKLLAEVAMRSKTVAARYKAAEKSGRALRPESWIDYFLLGDIYIMGFKLDFSESDIWWLLSYKKSIFTQTKTYFYDLTISDEQQLMFDCYNIDTSHTFINNDIDSEPRYVDFYEKICKSILEGVQ